MPDRALKRALRDFDLVRAFSDLGWAPLHERPPDVVIDGHGHTLDPVAEQRGVQVFRVGPDADGQVPPREVRRRIERRVREHAREHAAERLLAFTDGAESKQVWLWVDRAPSAAPVVREREWHRRQDPEGLVQTLSQLAFAVSEGGALTVVDVAARMAAAFDEDTVAKAFHRAFDRHRQAFLVEIEGVADEDEREWYASALLNRLMFVYFLQRRGFLDGDPDYLRTRLRACRERPGGNGFYRAFLLRLFHHGLGAPASQRGAHLRDLVGEVPYLSGGLFRPHDVERDNPDLQIKDRAFAAVFEFFDSWDWTLDYRPPRTATEVTPDVLGYVFEQYVNNRQMGAYYTKEDVTGYVTRSTLLPFVLDEAGRRHPEGFRGDGAVWRLLAEDPDSYIYPAVQRTARDASGAPLPLPDEIAAGVSDVARRGAWDTPTPPEWGPPTETWRETVARRQRYLEIRDRLAAGAVRTSAGLVSLNLDVEQFTLDAIATCDSPDLLRAFWRALRAVTVLDPTCGSGAFLFAALERLAALYTACLNRMQDVVGRADADPEARSQALSDFRAELAEACDPQEHPTPTHFVLERVLLDNLYGVDIMPEAVEVCKLRLFLKLASQVEPGGRLGPLPDLNVRAGNALAGYAARGEVLRGSGGRPVVGGQGSLVFDRDREELRRSGQRLDDVDRLADASRERQPARGGRATARDELRARLADQLDRALARQRGVDPETPAFEAWRESHRPFHWVAEFYGVMSAGGFDVVVGNPPYVSSRKVDYGVPGPAFPDIYASVSLRLLDLTHGASALGLVVPLSLAFSGRYSALRRALGESGRSWFSSFDNIPAALFYGVSQRCTIWIGHRGGQRTVDTAPMARWRADDRPRLFQTLGYTPLDGPLAAVEPGVAKLASPTQAEVAARIGRAPYAAPRRTEAVGYSQAARNFVSVFLDPPPVLDADGLAPVAPSMVGTLAVGDGEAPVALAALAGELYLWDWLVRGDGFHVTGWMVSEYLGGVLPAVVGPARDLLRQLGGVLWARRNEALQFKKNAGKYVGNYNWLRLPGVTRRADLLAMAALGLDARQAEHVLDYVTRVRSINVFAGEKNIPESVKALFPLGAAPGQADLFRQTDAAIRDAFGWTPGQLAALVQERAAAGP